MNQILYWNHFLFLIKTAVKTLIQTKTSTPYTHLFFPKWKDWLEVKNSFNINLFSKKKKKKLTKKVTIKQTKNKNKKSKCSDNSHSISTQLGTNTKFPFKTDTVVTLKYGQGHWKRYEQVKLNE